MRMRRKNYDFADREKSQKIRKRYFRSSSVLDTGILIHEISVMKLLRKTKILDILSSYVLKKYDDFLSILLSVTRSLFMKSYFDLF